MRSDLASLTPDALVALTNAGLVKRAQREIAAGTGPTVTEAPDGTVVGVFADGVRAECPPDRKLADARCSCGAQTVCRHRVATVLVYIANIAVPVRAPWEITDEALVTFLGARSESVDRAEQAGVSVEIVTQPPMVRFESCTVRFLAGDDPTHAKCDCAVRDCVHVGLAFRAMRALEPTLRESPGPHPLRLGARPSPSALPEGALDAVDRLLRRILELGIADARGLAQQREDVRASLRDLPWLDGLVEEIETQRTAWENRSALHRPDLIRRLLSEGFGRIRAARAGGDGGSLLGVGEPMEVAMDRVRLLSLGARMQESGGARSLELVFWDGAAMLSWTVGIPPKVAPAELIVVANATLASIARGQIVTRHVVRHARRTLEIRRGKETQVVPQRGEWQSVTSPVGFANVAALLAAEANLPPVMLRARAHTGSLRVIATKGVEAIHWSPARQVLSGLLCDETGSLRIERAHEWFAPGAIAALAEALPAARFVSGRLLHTSDGLVFEPIAVVTDRVIVPDLETARPIPPLPLDPAPSRDPLGALLSKVEASLEAFAQEGLFRARSEPDLERTLALYGLRAFSADWRALETARSARDTNAAVTAWADLAVRAALARERS